MKINRLMISKTAAFAATLMIATSAFAMIKDEYAPYDQDIQSGITKLSHQQVTDLARLPLSDSKSYKHWARKDLINALDGGEEKFENFLSYEDPKYKDNSWFRDFNIRPIQNNPNDTRHFGRSFHSFTGIEIPCLLACHSPLGTTPKTYIELACAEGKMVWKAATSGALVTANELSSKELDMLDMLVSYRVPTRVNSITKIPGSCFDILTQQPSLKESYDVLFSKNLVHFFNDQEAIRFAHLVKDLLKEKGTAYITANTFPDSATLRKDLFEANQKEGSLFPGFQVDTLSDILLNGGTIQCNVVKVCNAESNQNMDRASTPRRALTSKEIQEFLEKNPQLVPDILRTQMRDNKLEFERVLYKQPSLLFDTISLGSLFQREAGLELLDAFYLDGEGKRIKGHTDKATYVSVILKKPTQESKKPIIANKNKEEE